MPTPVTEAAPQTGQRRRPIAHEAALFVGLGLLSYALGAGIAALSREVLGLSADIAVAISLATLVVVNFYLNRLLVFRGRRGSARQEFAKFIAASIAMRGFEYCLILALMRVAHLHYLAAYTVALLVSNVLKFTVYRALVFRRAPEVAG